MMPADACCCLVLDTLIFRGPLPPAAVIMHAACCCVALHAAACNRLDISNGLLPNRSQLDLAMSSTPGGAAPRPRSATGIVTWHRCVKRRVASMYANMEMATEVEACDAFPVAEHNAGVRVVGLRCGLDDLSSQTPDYEDYFDVRPHAPRRRAYAEALGQPEARRLATPTVLSTASPRKPLEQAPSPAQTAEPSQPTSPTPWPTPLPAPATTSPDTRLSAPILVVKLFTVHGRWLGRFETADTL